jgi:hypothetical protein
VSGAQSWRAGFTKKSIELYQSRPTDITKTTVGQLENDYAHGLRSIGIMPSVVAVIVDPPRM